MTDDDELMSTLRRIAGELDPVPEIVVDSSRAALLTLGLDAELAELLLDSAMAAGPVRGEPDQVRLLSFQSGEVSLEMQAEYVGDHVSVRGLVDGADEAVDVDLAEGHRNLPIDGAGGFSTRLPRGAARFRLRARDGRLITTSWVLL